MSVVFADAFYFVARLHCRDQHHERVLKFFRDFRARLLTTYWVLMEVADALAESECHGRVRHLRGTAACEIVPATRAGLDRALDL
jgi:predicted nucleic acid-binding protein